MVREKHLKNVRENQERVRELGYKGYDSRQKIYLDVSEEKT